MPVPLASSTLRTPFAGDQLAPAWAQNDRVTVCPCRRMESSVSTTWPRLITAVLALPAARPNWSAWVNPGTAVTPVTCDTEMDDDAPPTAKRRTRRKRPAKPGDENSGKTGTYAREEARPGDARRVQQRPVTVRTDVRTL